MRDVRYTVTSCIIKKPSSMYHPKGCRRKVLTLALKGDERGKNNEARFTTEDSFAMSLKSPTKTTHDEYCVLN